MVQCRSNRLSSAWFFENASLLKAGPVADGWYWFLCQAAVGILHYAQQQQGVELKESWYEELQRWDEALEAYELKAQQAQTHHQALEATLGELDKLDREQIWLTPVPRFRQ
jgi:hypothetical protein